MMTWWVSRKNGGPTDLKKVHEFTDWDALDRTAATLLDVLDDAVEESGVWTRSGVVPAPASRSK
jgi:hypothetical protein